WARPGPSRSASGSTRPHGPVPCTGAPMATPRPPRLSAGGTAGPGTGSTQTGDSRRSATTRARNRAIRPGSRGSAPGSSSGVPGRTRPAGPSVNPGSGPQAGTQSRHAQQGGGTCGGAWCRGAAGLRLRPIVGVTGARRASRETGVAHQEVRLRVVDRHRDDVAGARGVRAVAHPHVHEPIVLRAAGEAAVLVVRGGADEHPLLTADQRAVLLVADPVLKRGEALEA